MANRERWTKIRPWLPLIGVLAVALAARCFRLTWPGIWSDEGFSMLLARSSLHDLFVGTANDLHPPLYYLLLKLWLLPGWSDVYVRLFGALWGVATVALLYYAGRRLFGPAVGTWAALYLALSPMAIAYSRQVRMYVVLIFLATLSVYLAWRWATKPSPWLWAGYVAVTLLAMYTQNLGLLILPVENVLVLVALAGQKRWRALLPWAAGQLLLFLGYLPWLPVAVSQVMFHHATWILRGSLEQVRNTVLHLALGEPHLATEGPWQAAAYLWLLAIPVLAGLLYLQQRKSRREPGQLAWIWALALGGILFGLALAFPIYQEKQFLMLTVPLALLSGLGTAALPKGGRAVAVLLFLALVAPSLQNIYYRHELAEQPVEEGWKELAAYIDLVGQPDDAIVINPGAAQPTLDLYLRTRLEYSPYPHPYSPETGNFSGQVATAEIVEARLRPLGQAHRRIWLVECCMPTYWDPNNVIPTWLEQWGQPVKVPAFPGIVVRLYERW